MRNSPRSTGGFSLSGLLSTVQLVYRLYQDERVPTLLKAAVPLAVAFYFIMPIDLIPDFIPGLGQLDDLAVLLFALNVFVKFAPPAIVSEHRQAMGLEVETPAADPDATTRLRDSDRAAAWRANEDVVDANYTVVGGRKER